MIILTVRTDKPEAEIGLFSDSQQLGYETWEAHRQLAETIHSKIDSLLKDHGKSPHDIQGVITFQGPGSFTGLRIGLSVTNALSYALQVPHVGGQGENWIKDGTAELATATGPSVVLPEYGAPVHITTPKK
ncbi:MAG: hypothetical protein JWM37_422 [Candidatus Saccharibacteria bacterium]|nr:hypothetical protein [Candidatus Saccharibacteria bacterium]